MSYFQYGNYPHPENEVNLVRYDVRQIPSPRGRRMEKEIRMYLMGEIQATGSTLLDRISEVIDAYSQDYKDATLYLDSSTPTRHRLENGISISGVRVIQRSWPVGDGAELAVRRTFSLTLAATYEDLESELLHWEETLEFIGTGGPKTEIVNTFSGLRKFQVAAQTPQYILQAGHAIGYKSYILPPGPLFPADEDQWVRRHRLGSGRQRGQGATHYRTSWHYRMTATSPKTGIPTTR